MIQCFGTLIHPEQVDTDSDGVPDTCDARPETSFIVRPVFPVLAAAGDPIAVTYELHDRAGNLLVNESDVVLTLTLTGSAIFGGTAKDGVLLAGGGTNRVLVRFVNGLVTLDVSNHLHKYREAVPYLDLMRKIQGPEEMREALGVIRGHSNRQKTRVWKASERARLRQETDD